jgi:hypothetical protein
MYEIHYAGHHFLLWVRSDANIQNISSTRRDKPTLHDYSPNSIVRQAYLARPEDRSHSEPEFCTLSLWQPGGGRQTLRNAKNHQKLRFLKKTKKTQKTSNSREIV